MFTAVRRRLSRGFPAWKRLSINSAGGPFDGGQDRLRDGPWKDGASSARAVLLLIQIVSGQLSGPCGGTLRTPTDLTRP
jgi:hypothetical protein